MRVLRVALRNALRSQINRLEGTRRKCQKLNNFSLAGHSVASMDVIVLLHSLITCVCYFLFMFGSELILFFRMNCYLMKLLGLCALEPNLHLLLPTKRV